MKKMLILGSVAVMICCLIAWIVHGNITLSVTEITVSSSKLPDAFSGYRIAQVSDLHNAEFGEGNEDLLQTLAATGPDIIVLTGDLVDSRRTDIDVSAAFATRAMEIAPVYFVTGNHEGRPETGFLVLEERVEAAGVMVLRGEAVLLEREDQKIQLLGVDDIIFFTVNWEDEIPAQISRVKEEGLYTVLLSHRPDLMWLYERMGIDLVFTGHAHGGQFRLPWIGGLFAPDQGLFPKYDTGLYTQGETNMIVSRGLGNSIFPFRVNNPPEIVVVQLENKRD